MAGKNCPIEVDIFTSVSILSRPPSLETSFLFSRSKSEGTRERATFIDSLSANVPGIKRRSKYSAEKHGSPLSMLTYTLHIYTPHARPYTRSIDTLIVYKYQKDSARFDIAVFAAERGWAEELNSVLSRVHSCTGEGFPLGGLASPYMAFLSRGFRRREDVLAENRVNFLGKPRCPRMIAERREIVFRSRAESRELRENGVPERVKSGIKERHSLWERE